MSRNDLNQVVAHTKFGFLKFSRSKTVVSDLAADKDVQFKFVVTLKNEAGEDEDEAVEELFDTAVSYEG